VPETSTGASYGPAMSHPIQVIAAPGAPPAIGPYSQAIRAGDLVFVSGQVPVDVRTGKLAEGIAGQTRQVIENLRTVLAEAGASLDRVVKVTIFLARWEDFPVMNEVYAGYFRATPPARAVVQGPRIPEGTLVGLEATAYLG
jgi:2-iminobutanoate/2-iminopropanoate deaminase